MLSLVEQIKKGKLWRYLGGVHPTENKSQSTSLAIAAVNLPSHLVIPVKQHIGGAGKIIVEIGDRVLKGQALTESDSFMTVPVHAPTSGIIENIGQYPSTHPSSIPELAIKIRSDEQDNAVEQLPALIYGQLSTAELQQHISQSGIAGMGGAGFPTAVKLSDRQPIDFLLINAAECEPYITSDDVLMREYAADIVQGIKILMHMIKPQICIIGIEDNKPEASQALQLAISAANQDANIVIRQVPTKYPNGGEKQLIKVLTGKEIGKGEIPAKSGIVMQNVGTVYAIKQAIIDRQPLLDRIVTLTGEGFSQPRNVRALIGTPVQHLLTEFHCKEAQTEALIYGGPMMGFTLPHSQFSLTKTGNCILAAGKNEVPQIREADACIRCGECAEVCPMDLLPQQLHWYSQAKDVDKLSDYNLKDCIECGACSYVCPSQIPLVHQYRIAKVELREHEDGIAAAAVAKEKFEKRNARLEQEKQQREQRQKDAAEKRRATTKASTGEDPVKAAMERIKKAKQAESAPKADAVAEAIARAKAKKAQATGDPDNSAVIAQREARKADIRARKAENAGTTESSSDSDTPVDAKKAAVAAAIARAKAKKSRTTEASSDSDTPVDANKAAVAAAIARAKAKKSGTTEASSDSDSPVDAKKAAVAAAIARAKAKKVGLTEASSDSDTPVDAKKAAVAAAIARAKAKKSRTTEASSDSDTPVDAKKAAVAAAIARAKAKKAAQAQTENSADDPNPADVIEDAAPAVDPKKAAVAAAIARAKAKKAAQDKKVDTNRKVESEVARSAEPATKTDAKKAAIAAAIAKAKAKKLAQAGDK